MEAFLGSDLLDSFKHLLDMFIAAIATDGTSKPNSFVKTGLNYRGQITDVEVTTAGHPVQTKLIRTAISGPAVDDNCLGGKFLNSRAGNHTRAWYRG